MTPTDFVLTQVSTERARQEAIWGQQNHSAERWLTIITEEVGEVARAILENDEENYLEELIQLAAVVIATVEAANRVGMNANRVDIKIDPIYRIDNSGQITIPKDTPLKPGRIIPVDGTPGSSL